MKQKSHACGQEKISTLFSLLKVTTIRFVTKWRMQQKKRTFSLEPFPFLHFGPRLFPALTAASSTLLFNDQGGSKYKKNSYRFSSHFWRYRVAISSRSPCPGTLLSATVLLMTVNNKSLILEREEILNLKQAER
jgi:hypothetical protein